jgi:hypothetical protein
VEKDGKQTPAVAVDPFLEPWSLEDCEEIGVDMQQARTCHELLRSGLGGAALYEELYRIEYENSPRNDQQTHMHLADTRIRLAHVYQIDDDTAQQITASVRQSTN